MTQGHQGHGPNHGPKEHGHDHGDALIHGARGYEVRAAFGFLFRRRSVYDGLVALSGARPGERVLDVGCGTGYFSRRAARAVTPGGEVVGIDPSQPMLDLANRKALANCTFRTARAQELPFPDASFDLVISSLAMHHVPTDDRLTAAREMRRVLRPGGRLLIVELGKLPLHLRLASKVSPGSARARHHMEPAEDLPELLARAGFRVTGTGDRWPSLRYVGARPSVAGAPEPG